MDLRREGGRRSTSRTCDVKFGMPLRHQSEDAGERTRAEAGRGGAWGPEHRGWAGFGQRRDSSSVATGGTKEKAAADTARGTEMDFLYGRHQTPGKAIN